jgi:hypothetical protein
MAGDKLPTQLNYLKTEGFMRRSVGNLVEEIFRFEIHFKLY